MNRKVLLAGLIVVVPLIALLFANLGRDPRKLDSRMIDVDAPEFALRVVGSEEVIDIEQYRGTPVVINFWATWCVPCFSEHPVLVSSARALGDRVRFVGVVYDDTEPRIVQFLKENGSSYPTLFDKEGRTAIAYGVYGVPESFFIDTNGKIVAKHEGPLTTEILLENLRKAGLAQ